MAKETGTAVKAAEEKKIVKHPTNLNHIWLLDVADNGQLREVAIVKEEQNGSLRYLDIASMDITDKGRLKKIVTSQHADKYPLWDLMSQTQLGNGKNALDYFHQMTSTKLAPGHVNTQLGGGLASVRASSDAMVGAGFTDPGSAVIDGV